MNKFRFLAVVTFITCCQSLLVWPSQNVTDSSSVLLTLDKSRPRLMLKDKDLEILQKQYPNDRVLQKCLSDVIERADSYMNKPMLTYRKVGPRLLHISRECLHRIYALGIAYRWTKEEKYAKKAIDNLLTVCAFKDWNPSHFLDTAEMSHAVGLGYDWLFSCLDPGTRDKIKSGLIKNGLEEGLIAYKKRWWAQSEHNWNQVCNGGLIVGSLAIAESDPQYAEQIITYALKSLPLAIKSYGPDGAWGEGPGYWSYATRYTAYGLTALETALGKDFGLLRIKGLAEAGNFPIYTTGPTGLSLNLADCGEKSSRKPMPCMFWLARTFDNSLYAESEHAEIARHSASAQHIVWYVPAPEKTSEQRSLDYYFHGPVEVAVFRSAWDDPEALFVGIKAGYNQVNHGHLDLGNFEIDAMGVRWARDLGSDNYNLPGYWDRKRGGKRWSYYRLNSKSHNIPLLGDEDQDAYATSSIIKFKSSNSSGLAIIDLTSAYNKFAQKVTRGVAMLPGRRAVLIQDEFDIERPCNVTWGMTTDEKVDIKKDGIAVLSLGNKKLIASILSPVGSEFESESAEQKAPQKSNKGVNRLVVRLPQTEGNVRVAILLSPLWKDGKVVRSVELKPLEEW